MAPLEELCSALSSTKPVFACGGSVDVDSTTKGSSTNELSSKSPPVIVRWTGGTPDTLSFPITSEASSKKALDGLLSRGDRATFGHGGKDVLDESYRKAIKLDGTTDFLTSFVPHEWGILDAIKQTLFSTMVQPLSKDYGGAWQKGFGVIAKLYKLNVYSAPSGKFKSHVDTPRGVEQFGSLIVCLPYPHEGGQLRVAHKGHEIVYDWSGEAPTKIEWAAFFSDCEHEVLEVTKGHRVTLTYNLFTVPYPTSVISLSPTITANPEMYPLFGKVKALVEDPSFMPTGGTLGFQCTHAYAHSSDVAKTKLPFALKGLDAIVYAIFQHLNLPIQVKPVLNSGEFEEDFEREREDYSEEHMEENPKEFGKDIWGTELHTVDMSNHEQEECSGKMDAIREEWDHERGNIVWLNRFGGIDELALAWIAMGNQASIDYVYSFAALILEMPPAEERKALLPEPEPEPTKSVRRSPRFSKGIQ